MGYEAKITNTTMHNSTTIPTTTNLQLTSCAIQSARGIQAASCCEVCQRLPPQNPHTKRMRYPLLKPPMPLPAPFLPRSACVRSNQSCPMHMHMHSCSCSARVVGKIVPHDTRMHVLSECAVPRQRSPTHEVEWACLALWPPRPLLNDGSHLNMHHLGEQLILPNPIHVRRRDVPLRLDHGRLRLDRRRMRRSAAKLGLDPEILGSR